MRQEFFKRLRLLRNVRCVALCATLLTFARAGAEEGISFALPKYDALIVLPVTIGKSTHHLVLDSGATCHIFHTSLYHALGPSMREIRFEMFDGSERAVQMHYPPHASVGTITLPKDEAVACVYMADLCENIGRGVEGILGMPFFRGNIVQMDFDNRRIHCLPAAQQPSHRWGKPIEILNAGVDVPLVRVELPNGECETCRIDTGYTGSIALSSDLFSELLRKGGVSELRDSIGFQINGLRQTRHGIITNVTIGEFEVKNLLVEDGGAASSIGLEVLRRFQVTFDCGRDRLYLAQRKTLHLPDKKRAVGISLFRMHGKIQVVYVQRNSPAEKAGIRVDDQLTSIAGEPIGNLPVEEAGWMLREKADWQGNIQLGIRRGDENRVVSIKIPDWASFLPASVECGGEATSNVTCRPKIWRFRTKQNNNRSIRRRCIRS